MSEFQLKIEADPNLAHDSLSQARDEYVASLRGDVRHLLTALYIHGQFLFEAQRAQVITTAETFGGVKTIHEAGGFTDTPVNGIECKDGKVIHASEILSMPAVELPLPAAAPTWNVLPTTQRGFAQMSFGGGELGVNGLMRAYDIDTDEFRVPKKAIKHLLSGKYTPASITIKESVVTTPDSGRKATASVHSYELSGLEWGAKLREEFAPDPATDPAGYTAWLNSEPIPRLDITFAATRKPHTGKLNHAGIPENRNIPALYTYAGDGVASSLSVEGIERIFRFGGLMNMLWQREFGFDMPMPVMKSIAAPAAKALQQ